MTEKKNKLLKVSFNNPGGVAFSGRVTTCEFCGTHSADHEDMLKLVKNFDKSYKKQHEEHKNKIF